jgi:hypothetical protein
MIADFRKTVWSGVALDSSVFEGDVEMGRRYGDLKTRMSLRRRYAV